MTDISDKLLNEFLKLNDFDEYMDKYSQFCGLEMGPATFRKEMELMEKDENHTHWEKESIRDQKKRKIIKTLHENIENLMEEISCYGVWRFPIDPLETVEVRYRFPNDRRGDIDHYLAGLNHDPAEAEDNVFTVTLSGDEYELIELMLLPETRLFLYGNPDQDSEGVKFLLRYNRIAQIENLMGQINYYKEEYRSLRSIPDKDLRNLLQTHNKKLNLKRDEIYEYLIGEGNTNPRWKSEQKAYVIVRDHYPDAKFQYQPDFLYGQRLDIYIPSKKVAIEYQGKQHYEPVEFFGGDAGYKNNIKRDRRKKMRCEANGIAVLYWDYDRPVTDEFFLQELEPYIHTQFLPK